jgi:preprotein translocase subunit YajC
MDANTLSTIAPLFFIMAIMYFLLIRPQQQQAKKLREKIGGARRGDTVVTAGGILGTVVKTPAAEDQEVLVEIADNVQVRVLKLTLTDVRSKNGDKGGDAAEKA